MAFESQVAEAATTWMDALWDEDVALVWDVRRTRHMVRETAWYAMGLLQRGDAARAERALRSVLTNQFPMDGTPFQGTFRRAPQEPDPPDDPVMWLHYDPNWREFIGTTFAVIVDDHGGALSATLVDDLRASIADCVAGEPEERIAPTYANIALMKASLDTWAGRAEAGESFARKTYEHFDAHGAFLEYNSPTYYGVNLWALALWRASASAELRRLGADIEERLWRDAARFYHAGLRNMCGPYDRAYGMDMSAHATPLGLYIWSLIGRERAPFPETAGKFFHPHDFCMGPLVAAAPTRAPDDVVPHLEAFLGEREIEQIVSDDPKRVVTAWLGPDVMIGGWSGPSSGIGLYQHAHATIHTPTGWLRVSAQTPADGFAEPNQLVVKAPGAVTLESVGTIEHMVFDVIPDAPRRIEEIDGRQLVTIDAGNEVRTLVISAGDRRR